VKAGAVLRRLGDAPDPSCGAPCALCELRCRASARAHILRFRVHSSYCLSPTRPAPSHQRWDGQGSPSPAPADALVQSLLTQEALLTPFKQRESHYTRLLAEHAAQVRDVRARSSWRVGSACSTRMRVPFARVSMRASIRLHGHRAHACPSNHISLPVCLPPVVSLPMRQGHIPEGEVEQYRQQYGIVQQLTYMLETEPHNTPKLLHLMQLLQVCFFHFIIIISFLYARNGAALLPSTSLSPTPPPLPPLSHIPPTPFTLPHTLLFSLRNLEIHLQTQQRIRASLSRPHRPHDGIRSRKCNNLRLRGHSFLPQTEAWRRRRRRRRRGVTVFGVECYIQLGQNADVVRNVSRFRLQTLLPSHFSIVKCK
jgi:hypothetical protein